MAFSRMMMMIGAGAALWLGCGMTALAQQKVGVVSLQTALQNTAEIKQAEADLKERFGPRQAELQQMEQELTKMQQDMQSNQGKYNDAAMAELQQRFQRRQLQYQRNAQQLQDEVNRDRQDVLQRVGKNLQEIVKKVADAKGLDIVVDSTSTLYFKPAIDISGEVTAEYDKAYPVKK